MQKFGHPRKTSYLRNVASRFFGTRQTAYSTIKTFTNVCPGGHELRNLRHPQADDNETSTQYVHIVYPYGIYISVLAWAIPLSVLGWKAMRRPVTGRTDVGR